MIKPDAKSLYEPLRAVARDMAAQLERLLESGAATPEQVQPLLDRWACALHQTDSSDAALRVRLHRLGSTLEIHCLAACHAIRRPDAQALITVGIGREWMAGAWAESLVHLRQHFPEIFQPPASAGTQTH